MQMQWKLSKLINSAPYMKHYGSRRMNEFLVMRRVELLRQGARLLLSMQKLQAVCPSSLKFDLHFLLVVRCLKGVNQQTIVNLQLIDT
jgi:hypothetical protein